MKNQRKSAFVLTCYIFLSAEDSNTILSVNVEIPPGRALLGHPALSACNYFPPSHRSCRGQSVDSIKASAEWPQIVPDPHSFLPMLHLSFAPISVKPALTRPEALDLEADIKSSPQKRSVGLHDF